ncbi:MAG: hypothetical protein PHR35_08135 [Kiritimatiellae bacterium]|nr:hypothetical protein [Kiritimatiellia bacterium]
MTRITVPFIDANIVDVTVTAWRRHPGERVTANEAVAELTTDKASFDLESPAGGTLLEVLAGEKSIVPIGYILALVGSPGETDAGAAAENAAIMAAYRERARTAATDGTPGGQSVTADAAATAPAPPPGAPAPVRATPKARRLAQAHGLDLHAIQSKTGAEIITESVLAPFLPGGAQ